MEIYLGTKNKVTSRKVLLGTVGKESRLEHREHKREGAGGVGKEL